MLFHELKDATRKTFGGMLLILLLAFLGSITETASGTHLQQPVLGVFPEKTSALPGAKFLIGVNVTEIGEFNAYEFFLTYDYAIVKALQVSLVGTVFGEKAVPLRLDVVMPGEVRVSVVVLGETSRGSGSLAFIEFEVKANGTSFLDLNQDQIILGPTSVPHATVDGLFSNTEFLPPVASPGGPYYGLLRDLVAMDAFQSFDPDGSVAKYLWRFGDASPPVEEADPVVEHVFVDTSGTPTFGVFTITLVVEDNDGVISKAATTQATVLRVNLRPVASLTHYPLDPAVGDAVFFDASASSDPDGDKIFRYFWSVDGEVPVPTFAPFIQVVFLAERTFTMQVVVIDIYGDAGFAEENIAVSGVRMAEFALWKARPNLHHVHLAGGGSREVGFEALAENFGNLPGHIQVTFQVFRRDGFVLRGVAVRVSGSLLSQPGERVLLKETWTPTTPGFYEVRAILGMTPQPGKVATTFLELWSFTVTVD